MAGDVFALADKNRERRDYPRDAECVCVAAALAPHLFANKNHSSRKKSL